MRRNDYLETMEHGAPDRGRKFADLIRDARAVRGWTQDQLVAESGVPKSTLVRWEGGRAERPDPDQVRALSRALGIDPRRAAVALGYLTQEELDRSDSGALLDPQMLKVIRILEDPSVPAAAKREWVDYLVYLKDRSQGHRNAG